MDSATILVMVLMAGVVALLVWFETNSRRNAADKKQVSSATQSKKTDSLSPAVGETSSGADKTKAA